MSGAGEQKRKVIRGEFLSLDDAGYAPSVPKHESPTLADDYTLIMMLRDTLQNGVNPTRANLALAELVKRMNIPKPALELDPEPYVANTTHSVFRTESAKGRLPAAQKLDDDGNLEEEYPEEDWVAEFKPRYGYSQDKSEYTPGGPGAMGWYDDPDGSGRERWWLGIMWSDTYRDKPPGARQAKLQMR